MLFKLREKNYEFRVQRLPKILDIIQFANVSICSKYFCKIYRTLRANRVFPVLIDHDLS